MTLYVLDTDHVTLYQRSHPRVVERIDTAVDHDFVVTLITLEEQLRGWLKIIRRASTRSSDRLVLAYNSLHAAMNYYCSMTILDFDESARLRYESLRQRKIRVGTNDLRIASTVLAVGGTLLTRNGRDFSQVPGLRFEDWSSPA